MQEQLRSELEKYLNTDLKSDSEDALRTELTAYVQWIMDHDLNKLFSVLYRIDVSEAKVKAIIAENAFEKHASLIASEIIQRQKMKIASRSKYS